MNAFELHFSVSKLVWRVQGISVSVCQKAA